MWWRSKQTLVLNTSSVNFKKYTKILQKQIQYLFGWVFGGITVQIQHNMDVIKEEPGVETWESENYLVDGKPDEQFVPIPFAVLKTEDTEESWHGTTIKEEMKDEIISDLDGFYSAEEVSLDVTTVKEDTKDEITTEEQEVCLYSFEQVLIEQEQGTTCSVTDVGESAVRERVCTRGTDPLLLSDTGSEKKYSHNVELNNKEKLLKCENYRENNSERRNLVPHTRIDSGDKSSKCKVTQSRTYTSEKPFKCEVCTKSFRRSFDLVTHSRIHTGEKPFKCELCNKCFSHSSSLISHSRTHTGEKPFKCEVCTKSFSQSSSLASHSRTHTGDKPFKCEVCNKSFRKSCNLVSHSRTHTSEKPFRCEVCNKCFTFSYALKLHFRIHTGEKPYKCEVCYKSFRKSNKLISHSRIHTGEKPFKCDVCMKSFKHSSSLVSHLLTHTGEGRLKV